MLEKLFRPKSVAVIGASHTPGKVGYDIVNNLKESGFSGTVIPVNPAGGELLGLQVYEKLTDYPEPIDLVIIVLPAKLVIQAAKDNWPYQVDLGQAWKRLTGLPFVFAVWATRSCDLDGQLARILSGARDAGCARAEQLAERYGPPLGWPVPLARKYLTHYMRYHLDDKALRSIETFRQMLHEASLLQPEES